MSDGLRGTVQERRCFYFFRQQAVFQLAGPCDLELWSRIILQAAHHDSAIRHATIALGSLYEQFEVIDSNQLLAQGGATPDEFTLQQYVKAIGHVLEPISKRSPEATNAALVSCVLFVCFEVREYAKHVAMDFTDRTCEAPTRSLWRGTVTYRQWLQDFDRDAD